MRTSSRTVLRWMMAMLIALTMNVQAFACCDGNGSSSSSSSSGCGSGGNVQTISVYPASGALCPGDTVTVTLNGCSCIGESIYFVALFRPLNGDGSISPTSNDSRTWVFTVPSDGPSGIWVLEASASGYQPCFSNQPTFTPFSPVYYGVSPSQPDPMDASFIISAGSDCISGVTVVDPTWTNYLTATGSGTYRDCKGDEIPYTFLASDAFTWESDEVTLSADHGPQVDFPYPGGGVCRATIKLYAKPDPIPNPPPDYNPSPVLVDTKTVQFFSLDSVFTFPNGGNLPWNEGSAIQANITYSGCKDGVEFTYELLKDGAVAETIVTGDTGHLFQVPSPGRYNVKVTFCGKSVTGYEAIFTGCDSSTENFSISAPQSFSVCPNVSEVSTFTINNTSECDVELDWSIEKTGGVPNVVIVPNTDTVTVPGMGSVDVPFMALAVQGFPGGDAQFKITATSDSGQQQTGTFTVSVFNPKTLTHNKPLIKKWSSGEKANAKLTYEGSLTNAEIEYQLYNVEEAVVQWSQTSSAATMVVPIAKAGRYEIRVQCCERLIKAEPVFVCYTARVEGDLTYEWDNDPRLKQLFAKPDELLDKIVTKTDQALKFKDAAEAKGEAGEANMKANITALEKSIASCDGFSLEMSRKIQNKGRELEANAAELLRRQDDMTEILTQIGQINQRLTELQNLPNPSPRVLQLIQNLQMELQAAEGRKLFLANEIQRLVGKSFDLAAELDDMKAVRAEIQTTKQLLNQAIIDEKAALAKDGKLTAPKVTEAKAIDATLKSRVSGMGAKMARFGWQKGLPVLGFVIDVYQWSQFDTKRQELEDHLTLLEQLNNEYKDLIANLKVDRKLGPLKKSITVTSQPGGIPFTLEEKPDEPWITQDDVSGWAVEGNWDWDHLVLLNGLLSGYSTTHSTQAGVTGTWVGEFWAYGNINKSNITARTAIGSTSSAMWGARAKSNGVTEEQMILLAEAKEKEHAAKWKEIDRKMEVIATALSIGLGLGVLALLIVGSALAGPLIIVGAVIAVIKLLWDLFFYLFYDTELMKSIKFKYPAEA